MKKARFVPAVLAVGLVAAAALGGCGGEGGPQVPDGFTGTALTFYATYVNQYTRAAYEELVKTYNEGQGVTDNVYVEMDTNTAGVNNLRSILTGKSSRYDVISMTNKQFKGLATDRGKATLVTLDDYLTDDVKAAMDWDQISSSQINVYRYNSAKSAATSDIGEKYLAGAGADLLAMPFNSTAEVLFYNTEMFEAMGLNIVSVVEADCGTGDYEKLLPHGYAEYAETYGAPFEGAALSTNDLGESVYKVFNNRIPMNWEELRCLARSYQKDNPGKYGYMSEWWFNYGWSVGGDCIGWNYETKQYDFTIGDKDKNFLSLNDITVNGTAYAQGEVLDYEDMKWLRSNASELSKFDADLYELPSMYEAFLEFNRLGVPANKEVETGVKGYGIAKPTTADRTKEFTAGNSPMLNETAENINSFNTSAIAGKFDIAPLAQYREYVGGSTRTVNGNEYLNVIGANNWTGEVQTVKNSDGDDVSCFGEAITAISSASSALAIPKNIDESKYAGAFKFISWACGPEGQLIMARSNFVTPNQKNLGMSEAFNNDAGRAIKNQWAASFALSNSFVGDWSYFNLDTWITGWSGPLNSSVRDGSMKLSDFFAQYSGDAAEAIAAMEIRIKGK